MKPNVAAAHSVCSKIDRWFKKVRPSSIEPHTSSTGSTATTTSTTPAPVDDTSCSASTSTSNASISNSTFVVSPASIDTDSCDSDAAEELLPPYPGKHRTTDRDVEPSKRCKYDENYIDLGFTYTGSSAFPQPLCYMCKSTHNSMKPSLLRRHLETKHANLKISHRSFLSENE